MTSDYEEVLQTPSVVLFDGIIPIPLWAVTQMSIESTYALPQIGSTSRRVALPSHDDTLSITAVLLGPRRYAWKLALENAAEASRLGNILSRHTSAGGLVLVSSATIRTDLAVQSLTFSLSASRRDTLDVSIRLAYLPRPGSVAKLLDLGSVAVGALTDALPF